MRGSFARGFFCLCVVVVALASLTAQAATVSYWMFNEKAPGNPADIDPITGAIIDSVGGRNGDAFGGDPFSTGVVYPRYVAGPTANDSAMRFTLQDWPAESSYVGELEDAVYVTDNSVYNIDLSSDTTYTFEAVMRAPDPMTIMDSALYHGQREGYDTFPQWYDYTDNTIIAKPGMGDPDWWVFRLSHGRLSFCMKDTSGVVTETYGNKVVTGGLWHQVAAKVIGSATPDNRKIQYYIDGTLDKEVSISTMSGVIDNPSSVHLATNRDGTGERWSDQFIGDIDSIRFSTGAVAFLPTPSNTVPTLNIAHVGSTDPDTEAPLRLCDRFYGDANNSSTWTASGYTLASGRLQEVANSAAYYRTLLATEQLQDPTGWTITGKMKLGASNRPWNECLGVQDGRDSWVMSFMDSNYVDNNPNIPQPGAQGAGIYKSGQYHFGANWMESHYDGVERLSATDPTAMFHTYQMIYDPSGDSGNGIVKFFMDGTLIGTQTRAEAANVDPDDGYSSACRAWFGDSYPTFYRSTYYWGGTASDAYWGDVKLQTGAHLAVPWDPNFDGVCGAGDLDIVRANWGQSKTPNDWAHGELTGDGVVGAADLDLVRSHWGQSVPAPGIGPVPEPSTLVLLAIGGLVLLIRRMR